ncbi:MAG: class I SAM-dependent RNA methyltransferase [Bacilli bacterium]
MKYENIKIEKLDYNGRGICHIDGKVTFVIGALENEIVNIEIIENSKKYNVAKTTEIITSSPNRTIAKCKYYEICGGCDLLHQTKKENDNFKLNKVKKILGRSFKLDNIKQIIDETDENYRNKIKLHVQNKKLGFFEKGSKNLVEIKYCNMVSKQINKCIDYIKTNIDLRNIKCITIRSSLIGDLLVFVDFIEFDTTVIDLLTECSLITSLVCSNGKKTFFNKNEYFYEKVGDMIFGSSYDSFMQVNTNVTNKLYSVIKNYINDHEKVLDLFCGTGTIGLFVTNQTNKLVGIELNKDSVKNAKKNAVLNEREANFISMDISRDFYKLPTDFDVVIIDPPRRGLTKKVISKISEINPEKIIYVSCNPISLERDLKEFKDYKIEEVSVIDMFPNTHHVECVCLLTRMQG